MIDPYTNESVWLLQTMARPVMRIFGDADVRVAWLVTGDAAAARAFLGPLAVEFLTFTDPDRAVVRVLGLERLPAMVHVRTDLTVGGSVQGWHSREWRDLCNRLADVMSWKAPQIPVVGDPSPFAGSPASRLSASEAPAFGHRGTSSTRSASAAESNRSATTTSRIVRPSLNAFFVTFAAAS